MSPPFFRHTLGGEEVVATKFALEQSNCLGSRAVLCLAWQTAESAQKWWEMFGRVYIRESALTVRHALEAPSFSLALRAPSGEHQNLRFFFAGACAFASSSRFSSSLFRSALSRDDSRSGGAVLFIPAKSLPLGSYLLAPASLTGACS